MRAWLACLLLVCSGAQAVERFVRVDFDLDLLDTAAIYQSVHDTLISKHGLTETEVLALLRPNEVLDVQLCVELLIFTRLNIEADGVRLVRSVIDRNVRREDSPLALPVPQ